MPMHEPHALDREIPIRCLECGHETRQSLRWLIDKTVDCRGCRRRATQALFTAARADKARKPRLLRLT
jgi:hypothetical protein